MYIPANTKKLPQCCLTVCDADPPLSQLATLSQFLVFAGIAVPAYVAQCWLNVGPPFTTADQH